MNGKEFMKLTNPIEIYIALFPNQNRKWLSQQSVKYSEFEVVRIESRAVT
jgi:hypothetical protein